MCFPPRYCWRLLQIMFCSGLLTQLPPAVLAAEPKRATGGLEVSIRFQPADDGTTIQSQTEGGPPVAFTIATPQAVQWSQQGLRLKSPAKIQTAQSAKELTQRLKQSGELTLEAWLRSADKDQSGPARIFTLSKDSSNRNLTLGQDGERFDVRLRTTTTGSNGIPSLASPTNTVTTELQHIVYTRHRGGLTRLFVDGQQVAEQQMKGSLADWDPSYHLAIGDELSGARPWLGTLHFIAIYSRPLSPEEVADNHAAGPDAHQSTTVARNPALVLFDQQVASILSNRCLECHDAVTHQGGLDLSRRATSMAGGDSGAAIVAGKPLESLVWTSVEADRMPHERDPLSADEKQSLQRWIEEGAEWSVDALDPAIYAHEDTSNQQWVQRLTVDEYIQTVRATVGVDIREDALSALPRDLRADGFRNTAYNLNIDLKHIEGYAGLAERIVDQMDVAGFAKRFSNSRKLTDDNMRKLISNMGRWVLRGPLESHEIDLYRGISTTVASAGGDFTDAVGYILQTMLQSPRFIYRIERQPTSGSSPVSDFELASRMSYILWGASPDERLLDAAARGQLNREQAAQQVDRMLDDPRAAERASQFVSQWLNLDRLDNLRPSSDRFPEWSPRLASDMRQETLAYVHHVVWEEQQPLGQLLNAQFTFATARLAKHYRMEAPREAVPQMIGEDDATWFRYDVSNLPSRGGLLTHGSLLTVGGDDASMVTRGLFLLHELLRGVVKDPPPCVDTTPIPSRSGVTQRMIAMQRIENHACGGCHVRFEPLAFGLERFDGLGRYQEWDEHQNRLREDGTLPIPGQPKPLQYRNVSELTQLLADSERVQESICWKLTQFAIGRPLTATDAPEMQRIYQTSRASGGSYRSVIKAIVLSDLVRKTRPQ